MDIRSQFSVSSEQLRLEFERTKQILHNTGKGDVREDALIEVLKHHLPARYAFARGEVVSPQGRTSKQCDAVIYDAHRCPRLFVSSSYNVFPIESVYGVMEVKSTLSSSEFELAHANIASLKRLVVDGTFKHSPLPVVTMAVDTPKPVGIIVSYRADRSLNAIAEQFRSLNAALPDPMLAPDFIVVLGEGYIGPAKRIRADMNRVRRLTDDDQYKVHPAGRHALLLLYLRLLDELDQLILGTPDLRAYLNAPSEVDGHLVRGHEVHRVEMATGKGRRSRIKPAAIKRIIEHARAAGTVSLQEHFQHRFGPIRVEFPEKERSRKVYEYNPNGLPPCDPRELLASARDIRGDVAPPAGFNPLEISVDGESYFVDINALKSEDWEDLSDETTGEYHALYQGLS